MKKLRPLKRPVQACLSCPPRPLRLDMRSTLGPVFGDVLVTSNKEEFASVSISAKRGIRLRAIERAARLRPRRDWRIKIVTPLYDVVYQRQGKDAWVLVLRGPGFA